MDVQHSFGAVQDMNDYYQWALIPMFDFQGRDTIMKENEHSILGINGTESAVHPVAT